MSNEHNVPAELVEVDDISIKAGSKKGDGFICEIAAITFQASFNGQRIEKNYIAKFAQDGPRNEMVKQVMNYRRPLLFAGLHHENIPRMQNSRKTRDHCLGLFMRANSGDNQGKYTYTIPVPRTAKLRITYPQIDLMN